MSAAVASENEALRYFCLLIYERARIRLDAGKHALIRARLGKRMRQCGFTTLAEYCSYLQSAGSEGEFTKVVDSLTTNFTSFMREPDHFDFLVQKAIPTFAGKPLRIWSAACSSGEEPYTIALYLAQQEAQRTLPSWSVMASDISTRVLEKASAGIYEMSRLESLPREWVRAFFQKGDGKWQNFVRIKPAIRSKITFKQVNLVEPYSHAEPFHVIFCRNVMIYFDRPTQEQLVGQLSRHIVPGGYLIIGHSESISGLNNNLRCVRPSVYQVA